MTPNNYPRKIHNMRFGRLLVIGNEPDRSKVGFPKWLCKCDCGQKKMIYSYQLFNGHSKSCGCLQKESRMKKPGLAGLNAVIRGYKKNAEKRNLAWELSDEAVYYITQSDCFYCEKSPENEIKSHIGINGRYVYNGIDRLDNSKGYIPENVVSCCYRCNIKKKDFSVDSMIKVLDRLGYRVELRNG